MKYVFWILLVFFVAVTIATADVPNLINYQGRLTDNKGQPADDGSYTATFRIYCDTLIESAPLWFEQDTIQTVNGLFSVLLGKNNPISLDILTCPATYLGIEIAGDEEIYPRTHISSVIYAYESIIADTAQYAVNSDMVDGYDASDLEESQEVITAVEQFSDSLALFPFQNLFRYYKWSGTGDIFTAPNDESVYITGIDIQFGCSLDESYVEFHIDGEMVFVLVTNEQTALNQEWKSGGGAPIKVEAGQTLSIVSQQGCSGHVTITGYQF